MWFIPKDYVWVSTRIELAHEKYKDNISIVTEFDIKDQTVIFTATVKIKDTEQVFTWHSFWEVGKEKAFEKLETVALWRALAFAWFEVKSWIASREEMEVFEKKEYKEEKQENNICPKCWNEMILWPKGTPYCKPCYVKYKESQKWQIHTKNIEEDFDLSNPPF
jgi:hypothetical protein